MKQLGSQLLALAQTRKKLAISSGIIIACGACILRFRRAISSRIVRRKPIPVYDDRNLGDPALRPAWRAKHPNVITLVEYIQSLEGIQPAVLLDTVGRKLEGPVGFIIRMCANFAPRDLPASMAPFQESLLNMRFFKEEATLLAHSGLLCRNVFGAPLEYRRVLQDGTSDETLASALKQVGAVFVASRDVPRLVHILNPMENPLVPVDPELLPGLMMGVREEFKEGSPRQRAISTIWAAVLNRLTANALDSDDEPFQVRLDLDGQVATNPAELINMLAANGSDVSAIVRSGITSFSAAMTVSEMQDSENPSGPCIAPEKIVAVRIHAKSMEGIDYLMTHCCTRLRSVGTEDTTFVCEWYFGNDGHTRWVGGEDLEFPWLTPYRVVHSPSSSPCSTPPSMALPKHDLDTPTLPERDLARVLAVEGIVTAATVAALTLSEKRGHALGGYPGVGSCNDSSAIVEYILEGKTTIYGLHGNASGRHALAECCLQLAAANPQGRLRPWFENVAKAILVLPEDWCGGGGADALADRARRYSATYGLLCDGPFDELPNIEGIVSVARTAAELQKAVENVELPFRSK